MYKTINATYDAASAESTENESCSLEIDAWNIRYQDRSSQMIDFLGSFQCKNEKSIRQQFFKVNTEVFIMFRRLSDLFTSAATSLSLPSFSFPSPPFPVFCLCVISVVVCWHVVHDNPEKIKEKERA